MKKHLFSIVIIAGILAGCATTGNNTATEQALIETAASTATAVYLEKTPADAPYFVAAASVLDAVAGSTNSIPVSTVEAALAAAGETNAVVTIVTINALNLADTYIQSSGTTNSIAVQEAAGWVASGISQGLAAVPASARKPQ